MYESVLKIVVFSDRSLLIGAVSQIRFHCMILHVTTKLLDYICPTQILNRCTIVFCFVNCWRKWVG
jgi:hypothetical protein